MGIDEKLRAIFGASAPELQRLWDQVQDNQRRIRTCKRPHDFREMPLRDARRPLDKEYMCVSCHGTIRAEQYLYYAMGFADGKLSNKEAKP